MSKLGCLVVFLTVSFCNSSCPTSWTRHNGTCYFFSSSGATWDNAMAYCKDHSGVLAEVKSSYVNQLLVTMAKQHSVNRFWIGGKDDVRILGGWLWMGSTTRMNVFTGYRAWAPGYPRNVYSRMYLGTRCAMVINGQWEDTKCDESLPYACQL